MPNNRITSNNNNTGIIYTTNGGENIEVFIDNFDPRMTDSSDPNFHNYNEVSNILHSEYVADKSIIEKNFREEPVPTFGITSSNQPVSTGDVSFAVPVGYVTHYVVEGPSGQSIIVNVTNAGQHSLHPGVVVRELYYDQNGKAFMA